MNSLTISLEKIDTSIAEYTEKEKKRLMLSIGLIASENIVSQEVLEAQGSVFINKYAEGYPDRRYYGGCQYADAIENIAMLRLKNIFNAKYVNVQAHSGSQANQAVFFSLLEYGDKIMSLSLNSGGHLSHGTKINVSGKLFNVQHYNVDQDNNLINYDDIRKLVIEEEPKMLIAGTSSYSRKINFQKFKEIANTINCLLLADIAHISGLVTTRFHQNPLPHAHIITSTTHKTLRGPRGGIIMSNHKTIIDKINTAIFPGIQGGPSIHTIAAKAVSFYEAMQPKFQQYIKQVILNSQCLTKVIKNRGYTILTDGTDNHLLVVDLRQQNINGKDAEISLEKSGIICNKNCVPFDHKTPFLTSGIRLGTASCTSRGFREKEFFLIGHLIATILDNLNTQDTLDVETLVSKKVAHICKSFPTHA